MIMSSRVTCNLQWRVVWLQKKRGCRNYETAPSLTGCKNIMIPHFLPGEAFLMECDFNILVFDINHWLVCNILKSSLEGEGFSPRLIH